MSASPEPIDPQNGLDGHEPIWMTESQELFRAEEREEQRQSRLPRASGSGVAPRASPVRAPSSSAKPFTTGGPGLAAPYYHQPPPRTPRLSSDSHNEREQQQQQQQQEHNRRAGHEQQHAWRPPARASGVLGPHPPSISPPHSPTTVRRASAEGGAEGEGEGEGESAGDVQWLLGKAGQGGNAVAVVGTKVRHKAFASSRALSPTRNSTGAIVSSSLARCSFPSGFKRSSCCGATAACSPSGLSAVTRGGTTALSGTGPVGGAAVSLIGPVLCADLDETNTRLLQRNLGSSGSASANVASGANGKSSSLSPRQTSRPSSAACSACGRSAPPGTPACRSSPASRPSSAKHVHPAAFPSAAYSIEHGPAPPPLDPLAPAAPFNAPATTALVVTAATVIDATDGVIPTGGVTLGVALAPGQKAAEQGQLLEQQRSRLPGYGPFSPAFTTSSSHAGGYGKHAYATLDLAARSRKELCGMAVARKAMAQLSSEQRALLSQPVARPQSARLSVCTRPPLDVRVQSQAGVHSLSAGMRSARLSAESSASEGRRHSHGRQLAPHHSPQPSPQLSGRRVRSARLSIDSAVASEGQQEQNSPPRLRQARAMRTVHVGVAATQEVTAPPSAAGARRGGPTLGIFSCGPGVYVRDGVVRTKARGASSSAPPVVVTAEHQLEAPRVSLNAWGPGAPLTRRAC